MNCAYCDRIARVDAGYAVSAAEFDLGSGAPRCERHWRYVCGKCGKAGHFMGMVYCPAAGKFFCSGCAGEVEVVEEVEEVVTTVVTTAASTTAVMA